MAINNSKTINILETLKFPFYTGNNHLNACLKF